jgi:hypothetical protein
MVKRGIKLLFRRNSKLYWGFLLKSQKYGDFT